LAEADEAMSWQDYSTPTALRKRPTLAAARAVILRVSRDRQRLRRTEHKIGYSFLGDFLRLGFFARTSESHETFSSAAE